ncbi:MAG: HAD family phosphatase [Bacteroidetes bacterium]|nr:HAD family phosphatase [Bacteroidota bacterium]
MKNWPDVDFIIFDLGNVLIDIDYHQAMDLMKSALPNTMHDLVDHCYASDFHKAYEKGQLSSADFRQEFRSYFQINWSDAEVDYYWNSLLGSIPTHRLELVRALKSQYQVGIFSNTNEIHIEAVYAQFRAEHHMENFDSLFDWVFYSHEMGLAKPHQDIYRQLLLELGTTADRVLFFDDLQANVDGAASIGIQAIQVVGPETLLNFFGDV